MRPVRRPRTSWPARFLRGHRPDRNPLRRRTDRVESAVLATLIIGFCAGAPVLGYVAVTATHSASLREMRAQHAAYHEVRATLLDAPTRVSNYVIAAVPEADARWTAPDGQLVTGRVPVLADTTTGSTVLVWTDRSGQLVTLLQSDAVDGRESAAALGAVTGVGGTVIVLGMVARFALNRRAMTAWDADWQATEPRWTSRR